jgi:molybdopterin-guanine dinucleotide biosynthesis protein
MVTDQEAPSITCSNPDCRVAQDGRCVEGISELASCSHYGKPLLIVEVTKPEASKAAARPPGIRLPGAEALPAAAAQAILRDRRCNVIALVGPHESGKTSLIGGIYDLLQENKVGSYAFAGSATLHAFERACHDARIASNRDAPHMERTDRGPATYFHLDLADLRREGKQTALFANRDGEAYMDTQVNPDLAVGYPELRRCDTLTLLADGMKLLDDSERHQVLNDVCLTIRAIEEAGQTRKWQQLAIVLTKIDAVRKAENKANTERAIRHFERIVADVREEFLHLFADIQSFHVSASPKGEVGERGEGMEDLLTYWMNEPERLKHVASTRQVDLSVRAFGRLRSIASGDANA